MQYLTASQKRLLLPIAELAARPFDWEDRIFTKSWDEYIEGQVTKTVKHWGVDYEIAFDQPIGMDDKLTNNPGTVWEFLFASLWSAGVQAVPVVSTLTGQSEINALKRVSAQGSKVRWTLRYRNEAEDIVASSVAAWFTTMMRALGAKFEDVDAVLDLEYVAERSTKTTAAAAAQALASVSAIGSWRSITLASCAFPASLAGKSVGVHQVGRKDWEIYLAAKAHVSKSMSLIFGDYGVSNVEPFEGDPRTMNMSVNLRYTHDVNWFVYKGRSAKDHGFEQYRDLCKILVTSTPPFMGPTFSEGDENYEQIATDIPKKVGPGNATQWRRDATNHHVHFVLAQLASLSSPLSTV